MEILCETFKDTPWWWEDTAPVADAPADLPERADTVIIGSGYTGLSAAIELARAGQDVCLLDAGDLGIGASTRNAGFTSGRAGVSKQINLEKAVGPERAHAILEEADEAYEFFQNVLAEEKIDCGHHLQGRFVGAFTPRAYDKLAAKMVEYNADGRGNFEMIPKAEQHGYIGSDLYHGGMFLKNAGIIHPSRYHRGLLDAARRAGARLIPQTRVTGVDAGRRVETVRGPITADNVVLATNGYTDGAAPWQRRRIMPLSSTIVATEAQDPALVAKLFPRGCPLIDTKRVHFFARPTPDGRHVLFGGRAKGRPVGAEESARILHGQMVQCFPELAAARVSHAWAGLMAFTFDFLPKLGVEDGATYAIGCNGGAGTVMMSWLGRQAAWKILGTRNRPSAFEGLPFTAPPFYAGKPWFVPIVVRYYQFRDWWDLREAARA